MYVPLYAIIINYIAVAEASKIGNLLERWVVVIHGWQSELISRKVVEALTYLPIYLSISIYLSIYLSTYLSTYLSI